MNIRVGAILLGLTILAAGGALSRSAWAQETTGRVTGSVTDKDSGAPLEGITVIVQGPQGEDATITDSKGQYSFTTLAVGTYVIRYYVSNVQAAERPGVMVAAANTVRVNAKIAGSAQAAAQQTYVITGKAPTVDVGSPRLGATFDEDFALNVPVNPDYGAVIAKAPGAFIDPSGNVSIGGATGLENIYMVNGINVTGLQYGNLEAGAASLGGGTNLPTEFLTQIDVSSGGYQAEFGGATGGVINTVLKSGSNEFHGSVFGAYAPYWASANPKEVNVLGSAISGVRKPDFDDRIGFEVGGPLLKDKLFFWIGFAPQVVHSHVFRHVSGLQDDGMGSNKLDAAGNPLTTALPYGTRRLNESRDIYNYAATINYIPHKDHKLEIVLFGTPSFNTQLRGDFSNGQQLNAAFPGGNGAPTWAQESLTKTNTDLNLHWTSKLFDRHWQIEAMGGLHSEYFYDRSPDEALNSRNQLEYWGSSLWDLEHIPGCEPVGSFQPCPVNPNYRTGGFGQVKKYTGNRWSGELKSTHNFEGGGHHEIKYGWHMDYSTFDLNRYYSGPLGDRALVQLVPNGGNPDGAPYSHINTQSFFGLQPGQNPVDFGPGDSMSRFPFSDLVNRPIYKDDLHAQVKSISNALFLQETYSPAPLRNLSVSVGSRFELQKLYDLNGGKFLDASNLGPRVGVVYDPFNDGRSKISAGYGRYYESVPLDIAARYFGGENYVVRTGVPASACTGHDNLYTWTGAGEATSCPVPPVGARTGDVAGGYNAVNNGAAQYQTHLQGQYQNEIVATFEREVMEDMTVRLDYTHRWLGTIIEDGYGDGSFTDVVANPGHVPQEALDDAKKSADSLAMQSMQKPDDAALASQAATAQAKYNTLKTLGAAPKPERTYDALTISGNKRFSKNWMVHASYTYSRLIGNYEGLFQMQQNYFAPNGNNTYDTPDLYVNARGPLPNDHPHQGRVDGFYAVPVGPGKITFGLSFSARSGIPQSYISDLISGNQLVYLLPRGSGGRTPPITQFDGHIAYAQKLQKDVSLEAYVDLFNILDQRAATQIDENYTYDLAAPIENGTKKDLLFAKNAFGAPVTKNANYGRAISYQAPFYSRLGLRVKF
jgi:hypothetical protein